MTEIVAFMVHYTYTVLTCWYLTEAYINIIQLTKSNALPLTHTQIILSPLFWDCALRIFSH